jgi:hypothetical protein
MAYTVEKAVGNSSNIHTKLQALLNGASISTLHAAKIIRLFGSDHLMCYIVYE